jgi:hypothetical protein
LHKNWILSGFPKIYTADKITENVIRKCIDGLMVRGSSTDADGSASSPKPQAPGSSPGDPDKKERLLGYESVLIMVLFCYIFAFYVSKGVFP